MLTKLYVENYVLIDQLEVDFTSGFNVITGETGSGKSLLLGALGLLLGQNADFSKIGNEDKKCISEGSFDISDYGLESFFAQHDIDYETNTIIRRELSKSGKSRAFINDTPVKLSILKEFTSELIDIHSQHENAKIKSTAFLYEVLDTYAEVNEPLQKYRTLLSSWKKLKSDLIELKAKEEQLSQDKEYYAYQLEELNSVSLVDIDLKSAEEELELLTNADDVKEKVYAAAQLLSNDREAALESVKEAQRTLGSLTTQDAVISELIERIKSLKIELEDVAYEINKKADSIIPDAERMQELTESVNSINTLLIKHRALDVEALVEKRDKFAQLLHQATNFNQEIAELEAKISSSEQELEKLCGAISSKRIQQKPQLEDFINSRLKELSMPNAQLEVEVKEAAVFNEFGKNELTFLVQTNKSSAPAPLDKVASGGEISRIMFLIKAAVAQKKSLKTLVLDEIDTGISGEVASKLGSLIHEMSGKSQILVVSHLAQMASKAHSHFKIHKEDKADKTVTKLTRLHKKDEVVNELAQMLSGVNITNAALQNAESLLSEN